MTEQNPQDAPPAAQQLLGMIFGYMVSQAIATAARIGVADLLKDGARSAEELALAAEVHPRALYRLLRMLASVGVFSEDGEGKFQITPLAEPLLSDAPGSLRDFAIYMGADYHWDVWGQLPYSIETGQPAFDYLYQKPVFDWFPENPEPARIFNDAMTSLSSAASAAIISAYDFSGIEKIVDVGGGHGLLLASILKQYPQLRGVLFDAAPVIEGAKELITEQGTFKRCELIAGNFFETVPAGGDAYIMKHIIHDWEDERAIKILQNCHQAMSENGKLLVVEMVIPEGNAPSPGKFIDLEMMLFLRSHERTEKQYRALYEQAGFKLTRVVPTQSPYSVIEGIRA